MQLFRSQLLRKTFLSYMGLLFLFLFVFAAFTFGDIRQKTIKEMENESLQSAEAMVFAVDQNFSRIRSTIMKLSQFDWIWQFSVTGTSFADDFAPIRRKEIINELQVLVENNNLLQNLTLFFPQKGTAVSSKGWFSIDRYLIMTKSNLPQLQEALDIRHNFDVVYLDRETMDKTPMIWMINTMDYNADPRIQAAFSFDKNMLQMWASEVSFSRLCTFTLFSEDGSTLVQIRGPGAGTVDPENVKTVSLRGENFGWTYEIAYNPIPGQVPVDSFFRWIWIFAAAIFAGPFLAWFLTWLSYRPIRALLNKIGQVSSREPVNEYRILEDAFVRLSQDNSDMKRQISEYKEFVQHDLSIRLLKGYFDKNEVSQELSYYGIDYTEDNQFCVLIASVSDLECLDEPENDMDSRMMATLLLRQALEEGPYQSRLVQVLDEDAVIILSDQKAPLSDKELDQYLENLIGSAAFSLEIWRGQIENRIIGISKSYHTAREKRFAGVLNVNPENGEFSVNSTSFYYPTDWEIQLINGVKTGNEALVLKILEELRQENEKRSLDATARTALFTSLNDTVMRLASELGTPEKFPGSPDGRCSWEGIFDSLLQLCRRMEQQKAVSSDLGSLILQYIHENYESSNLSLKEIAQELNISLSTASKAFKNAAQMNFYDYTCRLRMEKVKQLMREGHLAVRELCHQVGYENEYSLRRTFQRYEGISITEYREKLRQEKGEK